MKVASLRRHLVKSLAAVTLGATLLTPHLPASAQSNAPVQGVMEQFRIVNQGAGKETRVAASNIKPGETLEYLVRYTNKGDAVVNQFVVTLPIPQGLELLPQTDHPRAALASTDGVDFKEIPLRRTVKKPDGREVVEAVPLNEYRALRWQVGQLAAGKSVEFGARAKVETVPATSPRQ